MDKSANNTTVTQTPVKTQDELIRWLEQLSKNSQQRLKDMQEFRKKFQLKNPELFK